MALEEYYLSIFIPLWSENGIFMINKRRFTLCVKKLKHWSVLVGIIANLFVSLFIFNGNGHHKALHFDTSLNYFDHSMDHIGTRKQKLSCQLSHTMWMEFGVPLGI